MIVTINNESVDVDEQKALAALLENLGFPQEGIAVAVDWSVMP
jgi:sulfur carrier protein